MDWTRDQLAAYFDLGSSTVSMLENGQRRLNPGKAKHQRIIRWIKKVEHTQKEKARKLFKLPTLNPRPSLNVTDSREKNSKNVARISGLKDVGKRQIVTKSRGENSTKPPVSEPDRQNLGNRPKSSVLEGIGDSTKPLKLPIDSGSLPIIVRDLTCAYCLKLKPDAEITLDESLIAKYICDDCYRTERTKGAPNARHGIRD